MNLEHSFLFSLIVSYIIPDEGNTKSLKYIERFGKRWIINIRVFAYLRASKEMIFNLEEHTCS